MKRQSLIWIFVISILGLHTGCARITTQVVEKPRVDQEGAGNRGYLAGSAPSAEPRKSTRKIVETHIEVPTWRELNPWKIQKQPPAESKQPEQALPSVAEVSPPAPAIWEPEWEEAAPVKPLPQATGTTYTVQKGDTLEKIAADVYGDSNQWRRIFEANRDRLASPNRIYPGQKLTIPPAGESRRKGQAPETLK